MNKRLQNKISERLSGWYPDVFNSTIIWKNNKLFVKSQILSGEIIFNIQNELDVELNLNKSTDSEYPEWHELDYNNV